MRPLLNQEQIRAFDRHHIDSGVSATILMENAGRGAAHLIGLKLRPRAAGEAPRTTSSVVGSCVRCADERSLAGTNVLVLAGRGNNGGDGFVVARHLASRGANVQVLVAGEPSLLRGEASMAFSALRSSLVTVQSLFAVDYRALIPEADLVVDALLGTGADRDVVEPLGSVIDALNDAHKPVIALDIPSGLHATTGRVLGHAVRAQHTVTFAHLKTGLLTTSGHAHAGNITLSHIGVASALPPHVQPSAWLLEESDVRAWLRPRAPTAHKVQAGRVMVVAGSAGKLGAARLVSRAALRAGAGLVTIVNDPAAIRELESEVAEVMTHAWPEPGPSSQELELFSSADAIVIGPGLGQSSSTHQAFEQLLTVGRPTVLDADALRYLAAEGRSIWKRLSPGRFCVLTPHPGEAAALLDCTPAEVEANRYEALERLVDEFGACVLLKGSRPLLGAPGQAPWVSAFGSRALATGGSGDVLCGILAAQLVGQTEPSGILRQLAVAVVLQGQAAEQWESQQGDRGLLASEIGDLVPRVMARWQQTSALP